MTATVVPEYRVNVTTHGAPWRPRHGPFTTAPPLLLALVVGVIQIAGTYAAGHRQPDREDFDVVAALLLAAGPAALVFRRRFPALVLGFVLAATIGYFLTDYPRGPIFLALIVAFVTAVMRGRRVPAIVSLVVGYFSFLWLGYLIGTEDAPSLEGALGLGAWLLVLLTAAEFVRSRREQAGEAARSRAEESRRRASEERLRIARELHDVLAHNISLISVQAGVALHLMDERPEQARTALTAIKEASNEALGELRSVLDILRQGNEKPPRSPTSGLADLADLVSKTEATGLQVTTHVDGTPRPLPAGVDLTAYRIVQESLTNVTRHADGAHATVRVAYGEDEVTVQIDDDGRGASAQRARGTGSGIAGMRERAAALGGSLETGPRSGGGFRVRARLPLGEDDPMRTS